MINFIINKSFKIVFAIFLICLLIATSYSLYSYIKTLPKKVIAYEGISLGMDMSEVMYVLGYPDSVYHPAEDFNKGKGKIMMTQLEASKEDIEHSSNGVKSFYDWKFDRGVKRIDVGFNSSTLKVNSIGCYVDASNFVDSGTCYVNNIQVLDSEEDIFNKLGAPSTSAINDVTKTIKYYNYNMKINLVKERAYYIIVEDFN
jgi:hypothetical protein